MGWLERRSAGGRQLAEVIVNLFFHEGASHHNEAMLASFTLRDWEYTCRWLDESGLALYLLEQIKRMGLEKTIPIGVLSRLNQNQHDNQVRTKDLFLEFVKINTEFQSANVRYLNLKGLTLVPHYCSDPALRFQLDLDFLVDEENAKCCAEILMELGYLPVSRSGNTWEFKANGHSIPSVRDMYKPKLQRSVELHFISDSESTVNAVSQLSQMQYQTWRGFTFPALCESDKFLAQADHILRHLLSEWTRLSWIWEYRTYVVGRRDDDVFWGEVEARAILTGCCTDAIRVASRLATNMFGASGVPALDSRVAKLSVRPIDLWVDRYSKDVLLSNFPGSKLYLLLQKNDSDVNLLNPRRLKKLFPLHRPLPIISHSGVKKPSRARWSQVFTELRYCGFRLRFHIVAGLHYLLELPHWKRAVTDVCE
jgi:hypothetical protein